MMANWRGNIIKLLLTIVILLFSMGLRLNAPTADLPSHITFSGSILTDEGNQCHNSRSKALYDQWYMDDWRVTNYNPLLPYMKLSIFKLFGVGIWQMRLFSQIFAFFSLVFFFLTLKSYMDPHYHWPLLGLLLLGCNFIYVMYNKIGTFETALTFWVILTFYFMEKYRARQKPVFLLLAGAAAFMTFVFKSIMAYILPLPFAAYLVILFFANREERIPILNTIKNLLLIALGVAVIAVPWYYLHYLPNKEWIVSAPGKFMSNLMFPTSLKGALQNFLTFPWKEQLYKIPIVWLGGVLFPLVFIRRLLQKKADLTEASVTLFFFGHTVLFFFISYRPTRYFVPVLPAMVFMTVLLLKWFVSDSEGETQPMRPFWARVLFVFEAVWLTLAAYFCLLPLISRYIYTFKQPPFSVFYPLLCTAAMGLIYLIMGYYKKLVWNKPHFNWIAIPLTLVLVTASLAVDMEYYGQWDKTKTFNVADMSQELGEKLDNAYIGGMTAPVAVLENRHKALWLYPNFVNWDDLTFEKYPLTHALLGTDISREIFHFFQYWPQRMDHAVLIHVYHIKDYFLHLYSFVDPYITEAAAEKNGSFRLTVVNPGKRPVSASVGRIYIAAAPQGEDTDGTTIGPPMEIVKGLTLFDLNPGINTLTIDAVTAPWAVPAKVRGKTSGKASRKAATKLSSNVASTVPAAEKVLFYLNYDTPFRRHFLTYQAENFSGKTGGVVEQVTAMKGYVRRFRGATDSAGFLSYGPGVPYAPGVLIADFKLKVANQKSKLKRLCRLDIFSQTTTQPLAQRWLKSADLKENPQGLFRLTALLPQTQTLEFRVEVEKLADIDYDYLNLTYYQGVLVDLHH